MIQLSTLQADAHTESSAEPVRAQLDHPQVLRSADLFGDQTRIWIQHGDALYCLQLTRQGKLILTK